MLRLSPTVDDMVNIPLFTGFIRVSYMSGGCFGFLPSTLCNPNDSFQVVTVVIICVSIFTTIRHFLSKLSHGFVGWFVARVWKSSVGKSDTFFIFTPILGGMIQIWLYHIFQMGWFSHQTRIPFLESPQVTSLRSQTCCQKSALTDYGYDTKREVSKCQWPNGKPKNVFNFYWNGRGARKVLKRMQVITFQTGVICIDVRYYVAYPNMLSENTCMKVTECAYRKTLAKVYTHSYHCTVTVAQLHDHVVGCDVIL